jgi:N-acetylneuraminic acid mutarotase
MKEYRAKVIVTNDKYYRDIDTLKHYDKHQYNVIVNHYFNESDKNMIWNMIQKSYPNLTKYIEIYKNDKLVYKN